MIDLPIAPYSVTHPSDSINAEELHRLTHDPVPGVEVDSLEDPRPEPALVHVTEWPVDAVGSAMRLVESAWLHMSHGRIRLAQSEAARASMIAQDIGDSSLYVDARTILAQIFRRTEDYAAALEIWVELAKKARDCGDARLLADTQMGIGDLCMTLDDPDAALPHYGLADRLYAAEDKPERLLARIRAARALLKRGDVEQALDSAQAVLEACPQAMIDWQAAALDVIGAAFLKLGDASLASSYLTRAFSLSHLKVDGMLDQEHQRFKARILLSISCAAHALGWMQVALESVERVTSTARSLSDNKLLLVALEQLELLRRQLGAQPKAAAAHAMKVQVEQTLDRAQSHRLPELIKAVRQASGL